MINFENQSRLPGSIFPQEGDNPGTAINTDEKDQLEVTSSPANAETTENIDLPAELVITSGLVPTENGVSIIIEITTHVWNPRYLTYISQLFPTYNDSNIDWKSPDKDIKINSSGKITRKYTVFGRLR